MTKITHLKGQLIVITLLCTTFFDAFAGEFTVKPVRLDVVPSSKSASMSIANDGVEKISFQLQAMDWTQDKDGKDQYLDSRDLIFFPKLMTIEPGQEALVRIGFKSPATSIEKTYRLFIEELPGIFKKVEGSNAQLNVLVRFGLPIFAAPVLPQDGLAIDSVELKSGVLSFITQNSGNRHQMFTSIRIAGTNAANKSVFGFDIADRYLLASSSKPYKTALSSQQCREITSITIDIKTDKVSQSRKIDVKPEMCL